MNKNKIDKRREYVKDVVNSSSKSTEAVRQLAEELYLSERTIWRDFRG
jgi:hypothetical protein